MESKYNYEIIRDYLHDVVDKETAQRMRDLIRNDEVARNIAAGILQLEHEFNGDDDQLESYIEEIRQRQLKIIGEQKKTRVMSPGWIGIAAAIVIAIAAPVLWLTVFQKSDLLSKELSEPYPLTIDRGSEAESGFEYYSNKEYRTAIAAFDAAPGDATVIFYKGLSHLYSGDYAQAETILNSPTLQQSRYRQQAEWYRSLALIKAGKKEDAKELLQLIIQNPSHYKSKEGLRLLEELD